MAILALVILLVPAAFVAAIIPLALDVRRGLKNWN